jgi:hypothetical protein
VRYVAVIALFALTFSVAAAQAPKLEPGNPDPDIPTVTFTCDWPQAHPPHYSIAVDSAGRAAYTVVDGAKETGAKETGEPSMLKFTVSGPVRERIFADAQALNYFEGNFDFTHHKVAFTGSKTLAFADPKHHSKTTFNWSENRRLMSLTQLFVAIANTVGGGGKLEYLLRFDRLGLNEQLKEMEMQAKDQYLAEIHVIEPVLRRIADDPNVMDLARQRARRLLAVAASENAASSASR